MGMEGVGDWGAGGDCTGRVSDLPDFPSATRLAKPFFSPEFHVGQESSAQQTQAQRQQEEQISEPCAQQTAQQETGCYCAKQSSRVVAAYLSNQSVGNPVQIIDVHGLPVSLRHSLNVTLGGVDGSGAGGAGADGTGAGGAEAGR